MSKMAIEKVSNNSKSKVYTFTCKRVVGTDVSRLAMQRSYKRKRMDSPPDGKILSSAVTEVLKKRMFIRVAATIQDYVKKYKDANDIPDNVKREEHWRQVFTKTMEMELCEYLTTCCRMSHGLNTTQLQELAYKIWNTDETGIPTVLAPPKLVAVRGLQQVQQTVSRERGVNTTMIAFISASATHIPPVFIFPHVKFISRMTERGPPGCLGLAHPSHLDPEVIKYAKENGIIMLTFPPHSSHKLQPLDVSMYGPFKAALKTPLTTGSSYMTDSEFHGSAKSGVHPFNRFVFDENDLVSSTETDRTKDNAADCSIPQSTSTVPESPVTTAQAPSSVIFPKPNDPTEPLRILSQDIRPFPKVVQESNPKKRRTQGRTQILTATPEKSAPITERKVPSTYQNTKEKILIQLFVLSSCEVSNENAKVDIPVLQSEEATEETIFVSEDSYEKAQENLSISNNPEAGEGINTNAEVKIPFADLTEREWEAGVLLLLRQKHYLPFDALMCVSASMHDFYERRLLTIQDPPTKSKFKRKSVIGDAKITDSHQFQNVFNPIIQEEELTCSRLETTWSNVFPTVMPQSVVLNESDPSYDWKMDKELGLILHEVFEMGYTIPFIQSLKQFLEIKSVHDAVGNNFHNNTRENSEVYSDVWDGKFVKRDPEFINLNGAILGFQIYMDEVELANPLGSKKGKHKVSVFYWVLMNLPPRFRSCLRSILLLGIVAQVENIEETQAVHDSLSILFGINRKCCLTILEYFDPTKCFMLDLMHIVFECILNLSIALLLKNLMLDSVIDLDLDDVNYNISIMKSDREFTVPPAIRKNEVLELSKL
ncbi:Uncharacterized protein APZ42_025241 [Daphnia magna]|uniref:DDE-1 domain-containing protein n=1 Tax=Daphnia magna TaxID=35525 RepID=A0A164TB14_9CRUS|nr:Uncharacterized protein APZ42_025241 [Daphnia magna]